MPIINVNQASFEAEVTQADQPVLVDLWAAWCGPCRAVAPIVEEIAEDFTGKAKIVKINIDENPAIAAKYNVMSIPTLLFFQNGEVQEQIIGLVSKAKIAEKLNALL